MATCMDLTGETFGRLEVVRYAGRRSAHYGGSMWDCQCSCGKTTTVAAGNLRSGNVKSCGCLAIELSRKRETIHGYSRSRTYRIWSRMKERCLNPNHHAYGRYGGRGIKVCPEWKNDFQSFLNDMGEAPERLTLERKDNNQGYSVHNCVWASRIQQARNKTNSRKLFHNGQSKTISEWSELIGISHSTITSRLRSGWTVEQALTKPIRKTYYEPDDEGIEAELVSGEIA